MECCAPTTSGVVVGLGCPPVTVSVTTPLTQAQEILDRVIDLQAQMGADGLTAHQKLDELRTTMQRQLDALEKAMKARSSDKSKP
jgi:hypothetical protein